MTIAELRNNLGGPSEAYRAKQLHAVPDAGVVDREAFILERVKGKVVLDIGASGPMHHAIRQEATFTYGIDRVSQNGCVSDVLAADLHHMEWMDIDDTTARIPEWEDVQMIVCGEVIEHLSNPGSFLARLRSSYPAVPVIITVPNAFCEAGWKSLQGGVENVNVEHVAYYSYHTLKELVTRHGYEVKESYWYKGRPMFSEGLIFVVE